MTAYRRETELLTSERIPQTALLYLLLIAGSGAFEYLYSPERLGVFWLMYGIEAALCGLLLAMRTPMLRRGKLLPAAVAIGSLLGICLNLYGLLADSQPELAALANVTFVTAISMMMPWGMLGQAIVGGASLLGFSATLCLGTSEALPAPYLLFVVTSGCLLSMVGARSFDLHRLAIFRESTEREEEWAINRALIGVGATMNSSLDALDVLDRIAEAVRKALDVEWSVILLWDEARNSFRIAGGAGRASDALDSVRAMEIPIDAMPLVRRVLHDGFVEIVGAEGRASLDPLTASYMRRYQFEGLLAKTLVRGGKVLGILAVGTSHDLLGFTEGVRQLFHGIAQHAAIALDNVRLVADLRQADRLKSEFVSTMSHELRTPMNVILGYSDLFLDGAFGTLNGEQRHTMGRLHDSARSLLDLINATLEVNRLEAGRSPVETIEVGLADTLAELQRECEELPHAPEVSLRWDLPRDDLRVRIDPRKMRIVLRNLIGNALKFTSAGHVAILGRFQEQTEMLEVRVSDTGPGIDEAELPEIFGMFRQAEGGQLRGGVGLGLYIVKRFIDQLGGHIRVASEVGKGSAFTVCIPALAVARDESVDEDEGLPRAAAG